MFICLLCLLSMQNHDLQQTTNIVYIEIIFYILYNTHTHTYTHIPVFRPCWLKYWKMVAGIYNTRTILPKILLLQRLNYGYGSTIWFLIIDTICINSITANVYDILPNFSTSVRYCWMLH